MRVVEGLIIHHSATLEGSVEQFRAAHKARGYSDIGYHEVIGNGHGMEDGKIAKGRPHSLQGAAVWGLNERKLHVCVVGNFELGPPSAKQMRTLGFWLLQNAKKFGPDADRTVPHIFGHGEIALKGHATACPGEHMPLTQIRKWFDGAFPRFLEQQKFAPLDIFLGMSETPKTELPLGESRVRVFIKGPEGSGEGRDFFPDAVILGGHTYVKLTDLAVALNWGPIEWDPATKTVEVSTRS